MPAPSFRHGTLLIVDDEPSMTEVLSRALSKEGYEIISSSSGNSAFSILEEHWMIYGPSAVKVVISDWTMANGTGMDLLRRIRESSNPSIPFILMSGAVGTEMLNEALKMDADAVLLKPFSIEALLEKIDMAIDRREMKAIRRALGSK